MKQRENQFFKVKLSPLQDINAPYNVLWTNAVKALMERQLAGLSVKCPLCGQQGMLFSKWIPKVQIKPLYVCHTKRDEPVKACKLDKQLSIDLRQKIKLTRLDIMKILQMGKLFVLFSGGKDSLCLLHYINNLASKIKRQIIALHADTTAGFPEVEEYIVRVCKKLRVNLVTVKPSYDYYDLAKRWGIPSARSRWCCKTLKIAPIRRYLSQIKGPKVILDGIRAAESRLRASYIPVWYHPSFRSISLSPLFAWSDDKINKYIESNQLPRSPAAKLNTSAECWCGAYKTRSDFKSLLAIHPDIFDKLVEVEEAQQGSFTFLYESGKQIPLRSIK